LPSHRTTLPAPAPRAPPRAAPPLTAGPLVRQYPLASLLALPTTGPRPPPRPRREPHHEPSASVGPALPAAGPRRPRPRPGQERQARHQRLVQGPRRQEVRRHLRGREPRDLLAARQDRQGL